MKKIVIVGPILSRSGYGEMARFAFRALRERKDVDLYLHPLNWGNTGWLMNDTAEKREIDGLVQKTVQYVQATNNNPHFDVALQITIPPEWKKLAAVNIGYTAGIETNWMSPKWYGPSQEMDKIIVISEHAKSAFDETVFLDNNKNQYRVTKPIQVVHLPYRPIPSKELDLDFKHDFNFLAVCQWGPRKNLEQTINGFLEEFGDEEVGLVLKINTANDSIMDRNHTEKRLASLLENHPSNHPARKCSITLIHGQLEEEELQSLFRHPKIKAIVSTTHGEGFGLPLMEAATNDLPVIATDWSGHKDFLYMDGKRMFGKIDFELKPIAQEHVWDGVLEPGTMWAHPVMSSYKQKLREVYKDYGRFKSQAKKLTPFARELLNEDKLKKAFSSAILEKQPDQFENLQGHFVDLNDLEKDVVEIE